MSDVEEVQVNNRVLAFLPRLPRMITTVSANTINHASTAITIIVLMLSQTTSVITMSIASVSLLTQQCRCCIGAGVLGGVLSNGSISDGISSNTMTSDIKHGQMIQDKSSSTCRRGAFLVSDLQFPKQKGRWHHQQQKERK